MRQPIRVYADTSVYGGCFDEEFAGPSRAFFELVGGGRFVLVISTAVATELASAPERVRALLAEHVPPAELVEPPEAALLLRDAYVTAGVVTPKWLTDALHVATATVTGCRLIVSWNFRHIVNFDKIRGYNAINALQGYHPIEIHAPPEVLGDEEDI